MKALDLFCGFGGLTSGFESAGFKVTGVDLFSSIGKTFEMNNKGKFIQADLSKELIDGNFDLIIGGPPCRPWSSVNLTKRGKIHDDYNLLSSYFKHIEYHLPKIFMMENVLPLAKDETFKRYVQKMKKFGYSTMFQVVKYSDYGAATSRRRLILFGIRKGNADVFFQELSKHKTSATTVKDVIWDLRKKKKLDLPNHDWPNLKTIAKYRKYYKTNKFGWYVLKWNEPSPSFGNITKTYILHPDSFNGHETRVISVREALLIMGFRKGFSFPENISISAKYQMIADSVSPVFSKIAAKVAKIQL